MWQSGVIRRRRHRALAELVETAVRTGDLETPWRATPFIWDHFADEAEILRELQHDWRHALAGAVYVAIERGEGDLTSDVTSAFRTTRARHRGVRALLEHHADHPAIASAMRKERALLSAFGLAAADGAGTVQESTPDRDSDRAA